MARVTKSLNMIPCWLLKLVIEKFKSLDDIPTPDVNVIFNIVSDIKNRKKKNNLYFSPICTMLFLILLINQLINAIIIIPTTKYLLMIYIQRCDYY